MIDKIENEYDVDGAIAQIPEHGRLPTGVVNQKTYIKNNRVRMNNPEYKKKGHFVGSGAIKSVNKSVVQQRLKRVGMRWGVDRAQAILTLRAKEESDHWDDVLMCA
jgi:hypothetical protein